jgi:hypothetical protein
MTMAVDNLAHYIWHIAAIGLGLVLAVLATGHVVLNTRDSRAAIAWVGFVWEELKAQGKTVVFVLANWWP